MSLDLTKLVGVKKSPQKVTAQCPVCAAQGRDSSKEHLVIWADGRFGCCVDTSHEHRKGIWALVGVGGSGEFDIAVEEEEPKVEVQQTWPLDLLDRLVKDHSYWVGRGISEATVAPFKGGVATIGQLNGRYVFPQFNDAGEIIGFSGRCLKAMSDADRKRFDRPKWKHLSPSSLFVWGDLDNVDEEANLVESIGDSLALQQHGVPGSLCLFGTNLSERLLGWLIARNPRRIRISTNNDTERVFNGHVSCPGQDAAQRIYRTLTRFFDEDRVSILHPPTKDWGCATREQTREALGVSVGDHEKPIGFELDNESKTDMMEP